MWRKINTVLGTGRQGYKRGFEWGGNQGRAVEQREKSESRMRPEKKGRGTRWRWKRARREGREGGAQWDLSMIIPLLAKPWPRIFPPLPDSSSFLLLSFLSLHTPSCNQLCFLFSLSSAKQHCSHIIQSTLSKSRREWASKRERKRERGESY